MNKDNIRFTKSMRKTHTIYMPDMLHYHNELLSAAFSIGGYKLAVVPEYKEFPAEMLSLVNSSYCTCAMDIIGNLMAHLKSPDTDVSRIAILEPQAGGACRAGNYYDLIIQCLKRSGYKIPVLSLNFSGAESHPGFKIRPMMLFGAVAAVCYGDLLMALFQQIRPYEKEEGATKKVYDKWIKALSQDISSCRNLFFREKKYREIISDFLKIPRFSREERPLKRVGICGEIYIKCSPIGNRHLEDFLHKNGMESRMEGFLNYCVYVVYTEMKSAELKGASRALLKGYELVMDYLIRIQAQVRRALLQNGFLSDGIFNDMRQKATPILSEYYNIGDGWLVLAEAMDMIEQGYDKILIVHPFGCLVSHVAERGALKKLRQLYPMANINTIEYDYEQSQTLRESRIILATS